MATQKNYMASGAFSAALCGYCEAFEREPWAVAWERDKKMGLVGTVARVRLLYLQRTKRIKMSKEANLENPRLLHARLIEVTKFSDEVAEIAERLMSQYTAKRSDFMKYTLCSIIDSSSSHLFFLCPEETGGTIDFAKVWGMAIINVCQTCSQPRVWVDDFVVDEKYRRCGLAHVMMEQILKFAHYMGVPYVMLTANSRRVAANEFCVNFGFKKFDTNVYSYALPLGNKLF